MVLHARRTAMKRRAPSGLPLPHDIVVEIAGHVAARSARLMDDLSSMRATCKAMHAACKERAVARRVALDREAAVLKWEQDGTAGGGGLPRYHALVRRLAGAGNPEACFVLGLAFVFARRRVRQGAEWLDRAAAAGHRAAAYVLGLLLYAVDDEDARDAAKRYLAQVEGDDLDHVDGAGGGSGKAKKKTNRECRRRREQALRVLGEVTWKMAGPRGTVQAALPVDGHRCTATGACGSTEGWSGDRVFCSDDCRIRHEYAAFFSLVSLPVSPSS